MWVCVCLRACVCVCYYIPCYSDRYERTRQQAPTANVLRVTTTSFRERSDFQAKKFSSQRSARTLRYHTSFSAPKLPVTHLVFELPTAINTYPRPKSENKSQQVQKFKALLPPTAISSSIHIPSKPRLHRNQAPFPYHDPLIRTSCQSLNHEPLSLSE